MLRDPPDSNEWMKKPTWNGQDIMCEKFKPLSFVVNKPLERRPQPEPPADAPTPGPQSLPPATYIPVPPDPRDALIVIIDGDRWLNLDGQLIPTSYIPHPGPQSRYPRPKPVPGLSKKPRGRPVPTKEMNIRKGITYTCKVEGCHRVFMRSEHLKRHVRSLHMHEQNYMCALPFCTKTFARRDNLLQHERKHKHYQAFFDCSQNHDGELMPQYRPRPYDPTEFEPQPDGFFARLFAWQQAQREAAAGSSSKPSGSNIDPKFIVTTAPIIEATTLNHDKQPYRPQPLQYQPDQQSIQQQHYEQQPPQQYPYQQHSYQLQLQPQQPQDVSNDPNAYVSSPTPSSGTDIFEFQWFIHDLPESPFDQPTSLPTA